MNNNLPETTKDDGPVMTDMQAGELMLRAMTLNAIHHNPEREIPDVAVFHRGLQLLVPEIREEAGTKARHGLVDHITKDQPPVETGFQRMYRRVFGGEAPKNLRVEDEIKWLEEHGDKDSITVWATLADLYFKIGKKDEAQTAYQRALRIARETGQKMEE